MAAKVRRVALNRKAKESPTRGQINLNGKRLSPLSLNDKIPKRCHTLFVGINPGLRSAKIGHYYAGHSNMFWKLLHKSGIWPTPLTTEDDDKIVDKGFGLTDVAKRPSPGTAALAWSDFISNRGRIDEIVAEFKPKTVVFVSKTAVRAYWDKPKEPVTYGLQDWRINRATVFVVPSTSGASQADTRYPEKLKHFRALKKHIDGYLHVTRKS